MNFESEDPIHEYFMADEVPADYMDALWASGWRHFGGRFFRYNFQWSDDTCEVQHIVPLRIDLARFSLSKSQRRVLNKNTDVRWETIPARAGEDVRGMFQRHKRRFPTNAPEDLSDYLHESNPGARPCECLEVRAWLDGTLVAASFMAVGSRAASSIYGMFELEHSARSLGTLTLLKEIDLSRERGHTYFYPGYSTRERSAYDYKKRFRALEGFDWKSGQWFALPDGHAQD